MFSLYVYKNKKRFKKMIDILYVDNYIILKQNKDNKLLLQARDYTHNIEFYCKKIKYKKDKIFLILGD